MKLKKLFTKLSFALCSFAMLVAINTAGNMCVGAAYQPKTPKSLDKYKE